LLQDPKSFKNNEDKKNAKLEKLKKKQEKQEEKEKKKGEKSSSEKEKKQHKKEEKKAKKQAKKQEKEKKKEEKALAKGKVVDPKELEEKKAQKQKRQEEKQAKKGKKKEEKGKKSEEKSDKKYLKGHQKLIEIQSIKHWLDKAESSIAQYAGCSQLALKLEGEPTDEHQQLADASYKQYQAEECYRHYVDALEKCTKKDKQCLKTYSKLEANCGSFANEAFEIVSKLKVPEL